MRRRALRVDEGPGRFEKDCQEANWDRKNPDRSGSRQPFTLIFENESTAVPGRGLPIQVAGRKVVKINMFLT